MRALRPLLLAASMLALLAGFGQAAAQEPPPPSTSVSDRPDPFFGIISQRYMDTEDFDWMKWGRLGSFRAVVQWAAIEKDGDGNMNWEELDRVVGESATRGIDVLPTLYHTPSWLHKNWRHLPVTTSREIYKWKQFLGKAVERYGSRGTYWLDHPDVPFHPIRLWQIWNEPNIKYFARPVSPKAYAKLLRISAAVIRDRDPEAAIATGGLYARPPDGTGIASPRFMRRLYRIKGARRSFDTVAIHPYATTPKQSLARTRKVRKEMDRHGDRRKRMLITELGWGSDAGHGFGLGSQEAQGRQLRNAYALYLANRRKLKLDGIYWFSWSDLGPDDKGCVFCHQTGLFDSDGRPKPAWDRIIDFTHDV